MVVHAAADSVNRPLLPLAVQAHPPPSILTRLRLETRGEHEAVERVLNLMDTALSAAAYRQRLMQFYGFYCPLEAALHSRCAKQLASLLPRLNKTLLLSQDLQRLHLKVEGLPLCRHLPPIQTEAEVLGCLYVMEGATLGGRLITQHVQATFGIMPSTGGSFFEGYGADTGKMWQGMRQLLAAGAPDVQSENDMVASAIATFTALRCWCQTHHEFSQRKVADHA